MKPTISLFESAERCSLAELPTRELTTLFACGIVNPFGPTLTVITAQGPVVSDEPLPILRVMFNPFSQECEVVGEICMGAAFDPRNDLRILFPLISGTCPTLLLPVTFLAPDACVDFYAQILRSFADGSVVLDKIRRHPRDPWSRIQNDVDGLAKATEDAASNGDKQTVSRTLNGSEADELAASLLDPASLKAELQAFLFAWKGALEFQGSSGNQAILDEALSFDGFLRIFSVVAATCRLPTAAE